MSVHSETETVIKRILPYLTRRGYDVSTDLDFEPATSLPDRYAKGYIDILVNSGKRTPAFLIEAKRIAKKLNSKDRDQAINYGRSAGVGFVVVTNGSEVQCFNTKTKSPIRWNGSLVERIPTKTQLPAVLRAIRANPDAHDFSLGTDASLPFRPGLPLKKLNALFAKCHNAIRKIEKDEEHAFADFSKLLFLKLLEEKEDIGELSLPYSYRFHELAASSSNRADQVKTAIQSMIADIRRATSFGDVLEENLFLKQAPTFLYIVKQLSLVSFYDSSIDSKGAAFEYYVRATLKGKKLGQYFTPRHLVELMSVLVGRDKILDAVRSGTSIKVLDPACGTGGFLVYLLQENIRRASELLETRRVTKPTLNRYVDVLRRETFFGADANPGVASAAKMNMIIAGDGHTNICCENTLTERTIWNPDAPDCDIVITNPPFGTSESESLTAEELAEYDVRSLKGQHLFLQRIVKCTKAGGDICTVIDDGVLNTESARELRRWLFSKCRIKAIVRLPDETFKPNKINVRSSLLLLERLESDDVDGDLNYPILFIDIFSLGYEGSGDPIRGFNLVDLLDEIEDLLADNRYTGLLEGTSWRAFYVQAATIKSEVSCRLDLKYYDPALIERCNEMSLKKATVFELNLISTSRGSSPPAENYVDEQDGYAAVIKAGSNISKFGEFISSVDYIEKSLYDEFLEKATTSQENLNLVQKFDVLLASTGDGTLGKCCVYTEDKPAIADGHVTIIRVNRLQVDPFYLCDYLRCGLGAMQIERFYTGSTGLIELPPQDVDRIEIDLLENIEAQQSISQKLRNAERQHLNDVAKAQILLDKARSAFQSPSNS